MEKGDSVFVAGHRGLVGSALVRGLESRGYSKIITATRADCDLEKEAEVEQFFQSKKPKYVFLAAAKVGGIVANRDFPVDFLNKNLRIQLNVIEAAARNSCERLIFLGSSCIYPKHAQQPLTEDSLLSGKLEPTNQPYAVAKIAGIEMCKAYRRQHGCDFFSVMPANMYGPNDNYDLESSHILPALIRKFHTAKMNGEGEVVCWGTGTPRREFLYSDDLGEACVFLMNSGIKEDFLNVGFGDDIEICELANLVSDVVGYQGLIRWDASKPDGTPRKIMDSSKVFQLGWQPKIGLREGIAMAYNDFLDNPKYDSIKR